MLTALILVAGIIMPGDTMVSPAAEKPAKIKDYLELAVALEQVEESISELETMLASDDTAQQRMRDKLCMFRNFEGGPAFSTREIKMTLACTTKRWTPSGGLNKVYSVFGCESGFNEYADNPYSSAAGIGQALASTWASWKDRFAEFMRRWDLHGSVYNGRSNSILSVRVAAGGWGPWTYGSCA